MSFMEDLGLDSISLETVRVWGIATSNDWTFELNQTGRDKIQVFRLKDGRYWVPAKVFTEEFGLLSGRFGQFQTADAKAEHRSVFWSLYSDPQGYEPWPEWTQIAGAGLGPVGAEDGWPVGARVKRNEHLWESRVPNNVNEPLDDGQPSTWSRVDGTYVTPAGWQYQPDEDLTDDGGVTWWRVTQATSFSPSESPSQYVQIDGPGGDPIEAPTSDEWVPGITVTAGERYTYQGATYEVVQGHTTQAGWEPPNVPSLWTQV